MNVFLQKVRLVVFFMLLFSISSRAQQTRFIYIQTENKQTFYVKMEKRIFSSSLSGYIIIPKLVDSTYELAIGFPQNELRELEVTVNLKDTNAGFLLKKYGEKDWGLLNLQTTQLLAMKPSVAFEMEKEATTTGDEFARVLANVVNDPSIARVTAVKKPVKIPLDSTQTTKAKIPVEKEEVKNIIPVSPGTGKAAVAKPVISKLTESGTAEGLLITYYDIATADTVKVFLPHIKAETVTRLETPAEKIDNAAGKSNIRNNDSRFLDIELQNPNAKIDSGQVKTGDIVITEKKAVLNLQVNEKQETKPAVKDTGKPMINSDCKKSATEADFLKLRKQMAAEENEKDMIKAANRQFINTCFTTEQIKNLAVLFINQEEKYKFYVAAFPFVSDTHNFGTLEEQLTDDYYKTRFKAMLNH